MSHDEDDTRGTYSKRPQGLTDHSKAQMPNLCPHWLHVELDDTMLRPTPFRENTGRWLATTPKGSQHAKDSFRRFHACSGPLRRYPTLPSDGPGTSINRSNSHSKNPRDQVLRHRKHYSHDAGAGDSQGSFS